MELTVLGYSVDPKTELMSCNDPRYMSTHDAHLTRSLSLSYYALVVVTPAILCHQFYDSALRCDVSFIDVVRPNARTRIHKQIVFRRSPPKCIW